MPKIIEAANFRINRLSERMLRPWMVRLGWQPSGVSPVSELQIDSCFGYDEEAAIKRAASMVMNHTMVSFHRLASLWAQVRYLDRYSLAGSMVECGVWKGGAAGLMALAHLHDRSRADRDLHLFDSWEGLPEPRAERDGQRALDYASGHASGALKPIGQCVSSMQEVSDLLESKIGYPRDLLHYHKGWFQETLAAGGASLGEISLLRLDGDWYDSTKICLEELYPRVTKHGVVVIDDYGHWAGCRTAVDEFIATLAAPIILHRVDYSCRYWIKPD
ncbi:MAG: TylF/MycF/NovP-related O-methyltransferase [Candidatus Binatus sp.]|uniref:TylF/MycF/NovP-related O-methyltransferase n=1 Tax=Candidatus Binatus sp. TaxID=2811406 RepID=UPI002727EC37|nr:TylF/MycF/NovP-related O-methyltransferase [Candidatus Binatus sp.]MDO8431599.1 TylF/MycF/NovP-related O-methyltransferase [Candidatus Binatus sp.]